MGDRKNSDNIGTDKKEADKDHNASSSQASSSKSPAVDAPKAVPGTSIAASPPQFVTLEEVMSTSRAIQNMCLAHEIAINKDFHLQPHKPPENSMEKVVRDIVHRAFWDLLVEELHDEPPKYTRAIVLLEEIKQRLLDVVLPHQLKLRQHINEHLDIPLIQHQAENGVLDFPMYSRFILGIMGGTCAPARDDRINELKAATNIVDIFKGILEVLALMQIDLTNHMINMSRPHMIAHAVDYEKEKFAEVIKKDGLGSLIGTFKWLGSSVQKLMPTLDLSTLSDPSAIKKFSWRVSCDAYVELLEWPENEPLPETVVMDAVRLATLQESFFRLVLTGSTLLLTLNRCNKPSLRSDQQFKEKLREELNILFQDVKCDKDLESVLPNIAVHIIGEMNRFVTQKLAAEPLDQETEKSLNELILELANPDQPIRSLVRSRVKEFLRSSLVSPPRDTFQIPPGLSSIKTELFALTTSTIRIYNYNHAVFGEYYVEIIGKIIEQIGNSS